MRRSPPRKKVGLKLTSPKVTIFPVAVKMEQATVEELDEPMKIEIIPMNGMQVINIPINGKITIINPSMVPSSSETSGFENLQVLNEIPKPADVKMETDEGEIATIEEK